MKGYTFLLVGALLVYAVLRGNGKNVFMVLTGLQQAGKVLGTGMAAVPTTSGTGATSIGNPARIS